MNQSPFKPLSYDQIQKLADLEPELGFGDTLSQIDLDRLVQEWEPLLEPTKKERTELYSVVRPDGGETGVIGPRWLFHLFGFRHRAVEIGFRTQTGLIILQRRSRTKLDWPGVPDMSVAGHVPVRPDGSSVTLEQGAWKEIEEEIGLREADAKENLVEGKLLPVYWPYHSIDRDLHRNPPFHNVEARQIFTATLTGTGLSRIEFTDNEACALMLVTPDEAWEMLTHEQVSSGMRYSLPRLLDWLHQTQ